MYGSVTLVGVDKLAEALERIFETITRAAIFRRFYVRNSLRRKAGGEVRRHTEPSQAYPASPAASQHRANSGIALEWGARLYSGIRSVINMVRMDGRVRELANAGVVIVSGLPRCWQETWRRS